MDWPVISFLAVLAVIALIAVLCRLAAPRVWARRLCLGTLCFCGLLMMLPLAVALRRGVDPYVAVLFVPWVLIALEFLGLLHIYSARYSKMTHR